MRKTTLYLPDEVKIDVEWIAKAEKRSEAEIMREAIRTFTAERRKVRLPRSFGMVSDGSFDPANDEQYMKEHRKPDW